MSKLKEITLRKEFKIGMPNFSNQTVGIYMTWEVQEEQFDFNNAWNQINQQLNIQASNPKDDQWLHQNEHKNFYKTVIKTPKAVSSNE